MKKSPTNAEIVSGALLTPIFSLLVLGIVVMVAGTIAQGRITLDDIMFTTALYFFSLMVALPSSLLLGMPMAFILRAVGKYNPRTITSCSAILGGLATLIGFHFMGMSQAINNAGAGIAGASFGFIFGCVFSFLTIYKAKNVTQTAVG